MRTVISAFDDRETAHRAVAMVIRAGMPRDDVHMQPLPGSYARVPAAPNGARANATSRWFTRAMNILLGEPDPGEAGTARDAFRHGSAVVVAHVESDEQAVLVAQWMLELGAFDTEDRTTTPRGVKQ